MYAALWVFVGLEASVYEYGSVYARLQEPCFIRDRRRHDRFENHKNVNRN